MSIDWGKAQETARREGLRASPIVTGRDADGNAVVPDIDAESDSLIAELQRRLDYRPSNPST